MSIDTYPQGVERLSRVRTARLTRARWRVLGAGLAIAGLVAGAGSLATAYAVKGTSWAVMTDELQVARLATSIAETLSPVPHLHGRYFGALSQLYPLLISPFFGFLSAPDAARAAHAVNGFLFASAAWPAYLLARSVSGSRLAGAVAAALTAFVPWLVLASTLLTENAAYPAFVWAVFLVHRALVEPGPGRDLAALGGLLLAFVARTQLFVLAAALPIALAGHEVGFALARAEAGSRRSAAATAARRALSSHRVLAAAYGLGGVAAAALAALGSLGDAVGNYALPFRGDILPDGIWHSAVAHLDRVVAGGGVLPFLLTVSWALATVLRPERKEGHAFALLLIVFVPLLTLEVTSFDLRFTPNAFIQDRYLVYLAPLFAVGSAAAFAARTSRPLRAVLLLGGAGLFAWLAGFTSWDDHLVVFWAAPAGAFHPALAQAAGWVGLSVDQLVRWGPLVLAAVAAAAFWLVPARGRLLAAGSLLAAFGGFQAWYLLHADAVPSLDRAPKLASAPRDWVDRSAARGKSVALLPSASVPADVWWETELWNKHVDRTLRVGQGDTFTPFPADDVSLDSGTGVFRGMQPTDLLLVSRIDTRFRLAAATRLARVGKLELVRVARPYRVRWTVLGAEPDGWTRPGDPVTIRFYGRGDPGERTVALTLIASYKAKEPMWYKLRAGGEVQRGMVPPLGGRATLSFALCVPADGFADAWLLTSGKTQIADGRRVSLHMERLQVRSGGACSSLARH